MYDVMETESLHSRRSTDQPTPTETSHTDLQPLLLTIEETTALTRIGRTRLLEEVAAGRIESVKPGRRRLFSQRAIAAYIELIEQEERDGRGAQCSHGLAHVG